MILPRNIHSSLREYLVHLFSGNKTFQSLFLEREEEHQIFIVQAINEDILW